MDITLIAEIIPFIGACAVAQIIVIVSEEVGGGRKMVLQTSSFGLILATSLATLTTSGVDLANTPYSAMNDMTKIALASVVVTLVYFGSGFYLNASSACGAGASGGYSSATAASCDDTITFSVPKHLPVKDKDLFTEAFDRFTKEIVEDLAPIYEMDNPVGREVAASFIPTPLFFPLFLFSNQNPFANVIPTVAPTCLDVNHVTSIGSGVDRQDDPVHYFWG